MLICVLPIDDVCPALWSNCDGFPRCEYLMETEITVMKDANTMQVKRFAPREEGIGE